MWIFKVLIIYFLLNAIVHALETVTPKELNVRLVSGPTNFSGRVEIQDASKSTNPWGTICDDRWDNKAASVVCRQLGYKWGESLTQFWKNLPPDSVPIHLEVSCEGNEDSLLDCFTAGWGIHDCTHTEDAGVICHNKTVRLQAPTDNKSVGNVQVMYRYKWAEVCDRDWNNVSARLVCQELDYTDGIAQCCSTLGSSSFTNLDYSVTYNCTEKDNSLATCKNETYFDQCNIFLRASVICYNMTSDDVKDDFKIRISGKEDYWGRVEIRHLGVWGQICVKTWDDASAAVVCRQLDQNFIGGHALGQSETSRLPIWLSAVACLGNETTIEHCWHSLWGEPADFGCKAAYVLCYKKSGVALTIVDSTIPSQGRLQITFEGVSGSIGTEEWSSNDAHIACRQMGYASGEAMASAGGVQPYFLNKLICFSDQFTSILQCGNTGWRANATTLSKSAYVKCYKSVRLFSGVQSSLSSGIVQVYDGRRWVGLCDLGFSKQYAQLVCKDTSRTTNGEVLQTGAYGPYYRNIGRPYLNCSGYETSISKCPYDEQVTCSGFIYNYVSVSCYNGSDQTEKQYRMAGSDGYGRMIVSYKHQLGEICSVGWGDKEASVFCRSLGSEYIGGVALYYLRTEGVPMLLSEVACLGNESKMVECKTKEENPCYLTRRAGSVCFKKSAPRVKIAGGGTHFGRIEIDIDGRSGLVVDKGWTNLEAQIACKEINKNFVGGEVYRNFSKPTSGEIVLRSIACDGFETSILHCDHTGWRPEQEPNYNDTVGVYCYENVRIYGGTITNDLMMGRVQIASSPSASSSATVTWINVCADGFDQVDADVVCRQKGFDVAEILVPGFLHINTERLYYTNMTCKDGGTNVLGNCTFQKGECVHTSHNFANVLCRRKSLEPNTTFYIQHQNTDNFHGLVYAERYGIKGTVCLDGWDDTDASVICRDHGFKGGNIAGGPLIYTRFDPVWFTNVSCTNESSFSDCPMSTTVPVSCSLSLKAAGVLCYKESGFEVELVNDNNASYYGKIKTKLDGTESFVCRSLGAGVANTVCRQLGFPTGENQRYSDYGAAQNSSMNLNDLNCIAEGPFDSILECSHWGWGQNKPKCYDFAEVKCQRNVMTEEGENYGAVQIWKGNRYSLVCADEFDDADASVVCRRMGFPYGKSLCCSAFGLSSGMIEISDVQCTGSEMNIDDCAMTRGFKSCPSGDYASVVCSKEEPPLEFTVRVDKAVTPAHLRTPFPSGSGIGPVQINYFNQDGFICDSDFDNNDAMVICRQLGFSSGFAYRHLNRLNHGKTDDVYWMKGPNCTGKENLLVNCPGIHFGDVRNCSVMSKAAVFCQKEQGEIDYEVRLSNGGHPGEGFVEVKVNDTWGSICTYNAVISQHVASVICRELGFNDGYPTVMQGATTLKGAVWLNGVHCEGHETKLKDCMLSGFGETVSATCMGHGYDLAVTCYSEVRLSHTSAPNYGMVNVLSDFLGAKDWVSVCDTGFDDVDAKVVCRNLGYKDGKAQCCSSLGVRLTKYTPIGIANVRCNGTESSFSQCEKEDGNVTCESGMYASALCTDTTPPVEDIHIELKGGSYYGDVQVRRYGVSGSMCDEGWDDNDATVLCRSIGFVVGYATNGTNIGGDPMLLTSVDCDGNESSISNCKYPPLSKEFACNSRSTRAAAVCSMDDEKVRYRVADIRNERGRAEIYFNGRWGTICDIFWDDADADIFCKQAGYLFGKATSVVRPGNDDMPIWMSRVECTGNETDFFQCRASWDPVQTSKCSHYEDAGVRCYSTAYIIDEAGGRRYYESIHYCNSSLLEQDQKRSLFRNNIKDKRSKSFLHGTGSSVRLFRGDYRTKRTNGIVKIYVPQKEPLRSPWLTVCADTFTDKEADVVCRILGHEHGISLCCGPYGYSTFPMASFRLKCNGTETQTTDCQQVVNDTKCSRQNYASVSCYNGTRPKDDYSLRLKGSLRYTGQVVVTYLGVPGSICWTGWTDADARVVCRELGFKNGSAYYHYKSSFIYLDYNGPYWTSDVQCLGNETRLSNCPHKGFGNVTKCRDRGHYAGVICYDDSDMAFRISGGNDRYGRVEFSYNNRWHPFCSQRWGYQEADVMCRQLGYVTGDTYSGNYNDVAAEQPYAIDFRCTGNEENITSCPHEGLDESPYCMNHKDDEGVFCYTQVKLSGQSGVNNGNGTVLFYHKKEWWLVCDDGFDDVTAKRVCRELGFVDGHAICCSAYGKVYEDILTNYTLRCTGEEESIEQCLRNESCNSTYYASAVCFSSLDGANDESYKFEIAKTEKGQVHVTHYGVKGRICSRDWDDRDAMVFCKTQGFDHGLSYQHSESNVLRDVRGPYWLSGFNCTGNETSLLDCSFMDRTDLGNCSGNDIASVLCYNESGVKYRIADGGEHYGRVEISVGGTWGTICDSFWDEREASIFCRQMNFTDGEPVGRAHFGQGKGPIWLSHLECKGTEKKLHECPHRGFANEFSFDWWFPLPCETHSDDAGVFCYKSVRLNNGPNSNSGGLEMYHNEKWFSVCDTNFGLNEAKVACRSLKSEYMDARAIPGSAYGNKSKPILFTHVNCAGDEKDITQCKMDVNSTCPSGNYVSVECSNTTFVDDGFQMRLSSDSLAGQVHGILEVKIGGIWGRICLHNFDDTDASVACRQLGFDGGVAYLHIMKNDRPVLMREVRCLGNETSLDQCQSEKFTPDVEHCSYGSNDAGVVCYNVTNGIGFEYRLQGGPDSSAGRVEIGYAGAWGAVCSWSWQSADARVLCRTMGYDDGIVNYTKEGPLLPTIRPWVTGFFCLGTEPSPLTCLNTGFNSSFLADLCVGRKEQGAYTKCFNTSVVPTKIRLVDGPNNYTGRVEVFVTGANEWGTICDDHWDNVDAGVVCRQLGYYGGIARRKAEFGSGTGPIWFDNTKCNGTEKALFECEHRGIGTHNCNHKEDVGVICSVTPSEENTSTTKVPATVVSTTVQSFTTKPTVKSATITSPTATSPRTTTFAKMSTTASTTSPKTITTSAKSSSTTATNPSSTTTSLSTASMTLPTTSKPPVRKTSTPTSTTQTTQERTTEKSTTATKASTKRTKSYTTVMQTTPTSSKSTNRTEGFQRTPPARAGIAAAVAVPVCILLLIILIILIVIFVKRRKRKQGYGREMFDDSIISEDQQGSVSATNQIFDLDLQPTNSNGFTDSENSEKVRINKNGKAAYSKDKNGIDSNAFSNPLYEASKNLCNAEDSDLQLPIQGEIEFKNDKYEYS